jgi:hypothetical protein
VVKLTLQNCAARCGSRNSWSGVIIAMTNPPKS